MLIETFDNQLIESHTDFDHHEKIIRCVDETTGLHAIIAIHNRNLGPALGGCRMYPYASEQEALTDVLRLSRGMTYKSALAGLPLGGGKAVIIGDANTEKTPELMQAMGSFVESFQGQYITAEDSGTSVADIQQMQINTHHIAGVVERRLGNGKLVDGDPSPSTAYGVYCGIRLPSPTDLALLHVRAPKSLCKGLATSAVTWSNCW